MTTPADIAAFLAHSPLRYGLKWCCENTEHTCTPDTCNEQCLKDAAQDLARFINKESEA